MMDKRDKIERIWVYQPFKRKLMVAAKTNDMTLTKYTKLLSELDDPLKDFRKEKHNGRFII